MAIAIYICYVDKEVKLFELAEDKHGQFLRNGEHKDKDLIAY